MRSMIKSAVSTAARKAKIYHRTESKSHTHFVKQTHSEGYCGHTTNYSTPKLLTQHKLLYNHHLSLTL